MNTFTELQRAKDINEYYGITLKNMVYFKKIKNHIFR